MRMIPRSPVMSTSLLTPRELVVLQILAQGLTNKAIAAALCVGETTVATHLKAIFRKLDVHNRVQAVRVGYEQGLLFPRNKTVKPGKKPLHARARTDAKSPK